MNQPSGVVLARRCLVLGALFGAVAACEGAVAGGAGEPSADPYADDESHPIPFVDRLDVMATKADGGAMLAIIIASPLRGDSRSILRLVRKLQNYVAFIGSEDFRSKHGAPTMANTEIQVVIPSASDPLIFENLERMKPWVASRDATLVVDKRQ